MGGHRNSYRTARPVILQAGRSRQSMCVYVEVGERASNKSNFMENKKKKGQRESRQA